MPLTVNSVKKWWLISGLVLVALVVFAAQAALYLLPLDLKDRSPVQPVAFSHKAHAGDQAIPCLYCHRYAQKSPVAGIPALSDCRACHQFIAPEAPEVKKLMGYWDKKEPIPWVRVHRVPDHVYFPHMMHLRAGLECGTCHGEVAAMERLSRVASLKMGWCLECHRERKASIDCWTCHI